MPSLDFKRLKSLGDLDFLGGIFEGRERRRGRCCRGRSYFVIRRINGSGSGLNVSVATRIKCVLVLGPDGVRCARQSFPRLEGQRRTMRSGLIYVYTTLVRRRRAVDMETISIYSPQGMFTMT